MDVPEDLICPKCKNLLAQPFQLRCRHNVCHKCVFEMITVNDVDHPSLKSSLIVSIKLTLLNDTESALKDPTKTVEISCPKCLDQMAIIYKPNSYEKFPVQTNINKNNDLESVIKTFQDLQKKVSLTFKDQEDFCKFHQMERMKLVLYCTVCKEDICHRCAVEGHQSHGIISLYLKSVYETDYCQIQPMKANIKIFKENLSHKLIEFENVKKKEHYEFTDYLSKVELEFQNLIKCLKAKHLEILSHLKNERQILFLKNSNVVSCFRSKIDELSKIEEELDEHERGASHNGLRNTLEMGQRALIEWKSPNIENSNVSKHLVEALQTIDDMIENLTLGDEDINHNTHLGDTSPVKMRSTRKRRSCSRVLEMDTYERSQTHDE